ncbi:MULTISPECIES: CU044_5270 family protein [Actinomadura]|uniref:CU044_5270 family protein n=1 Tax=Actinomadura yumaensis TaxID=111807 RepID=A0ABW2CFH2_9ACTN|nr:CU044_5270 family protein [Actinomadura sp. J1-007]MWK34803.1 hypothetical protein [Actinomadura sp. J1-007]
MNRDLMRTLAEARPSELNPDAPVDAATRAGELSRAMAATSAEHTAPSRRRSRLGWGLGAAAVTAAAAVAVAATVSGGGTSDRPEGDHPPVALDAKTVLLSAAHGASGQPDTTGDYWHQVAVERGYFQVGKGASGYVVASSTRTEGWTPNVKGGRFWSREQHLGARPATPADAAAWRRQGSPSTFMTVLPVRVAKGPLKEMPVKAAPGKTRTTRSAPVGGQKVFWLGRNVTVKEVLALPTDPSRLKASLLRWYDGHDTEAPDVPMARDTWLFQVTAGLITDMPVRPAVRAAAFRMLAGLHGVRSLGAVKDPEGRPGVAVATVEHTPIGDQERRLVIDQKRGAALSSQIILLKPKNGIRATWRPGSPITTTTYLASDWTTPTPH